jgi:hypothetical protein
MTSCHVTLVTRAVIGAFPSSLQPVRRQPIAPPIINIGNRANTERQMRREHGR